MASSEEVGFTSRRHALIVPLADAHLGPFGTMPWWLLVPLVVYWAVV